MCQKILLAALKVGCSDKRDKIKREGLYQDYNNQFAPWARCDGHFANRVWQEHDLHGVCAHQTRIDLNKNMYSHYFATEKHHRRSDIGNVVAKLHSIGTVG